MTNFASCFISYAQPDVEIAMRINEFLKRNGVRTWAWYENQVIGEWRPRIQQAMDDHEYILLLVSKASLDRPGVQDENRLALADDLRPYPRRLLPILLDDLEAISPPPDMPEARELLNMVKRVFRLRLPSGSGPRLTPEFRRRLLAILERPVSKILVIGSVSVESRAENETKRAFVGSVARSIGKCLALHRTKPICMTTMGGGLDFLVCSGFADSAKQKDIAGRLFLYPPARDRIHYAGAGRRVEIAYLPEFEGQENLVLLDSRGRVLVSKMAADADSVIAIRGGRGIEYAFTICLAEKKRFVAIPALGGMSAKLFGIYSRLPNVAAPECCREEPRWDAGPDLAEKYAEEVVSLALESL